MTTGRIGSMNVNVYEAKRALLSPVFQLEDNSYVTLMSKEDAERGKLARLVKQGYKMNEGIKMVHVDGIYAIGVVMHEDEASAYEPNMYFDDADYDDDVLNDVITERFTDRLIDKDKTYDDSCFGV